MPSTSKFKAARSLKGWLALCYGSTSPEWNCLPGFSRREPGGLHFGGGFMSRHQNPRPLARHLPGFGIIIYRRRRSGRMYTTPVNVFRHSDRYM